MEVIELVAGDITKPFTPQHAQDLINLERELGVNNWKLTDKAAETYEVTQDGILRRKDSNRPDPKPEAPKGANKGKAA